MRPGAEGEEGRCTEGGLVWKCHFCNCSFSPPSVFLLLFPFYWYRYAAWGVSAKCCPLQGANGLHRTGPVLCVCVLQTCEMQLKPNTSEVREDWLVLTSLWGPGPRVWFKQQDRKDSAVWKLQKLFGDKTTVPKWRCLTCVSPCSFSHHTWPYLWKVPKVSVIGNKSTDNQFWRKCLTHQLCCRKA